MLLTSPTSSGTVLWKTTIPINRSQQAISIR